MTERDRALVDALVELADTLVSDFDISDLFYRLVENCVALADADEAGLLLKDRDGILGIATATSDSTHLVELLQLQADEGPCLDAYRTGQPVRSGPLDEEQARERWPKFAKLASEAGFHAVIAIPMRLRDTVLGSLNLFRIGPGEASDDDVAAASAMADLATIAILQNQTNADAHEIIDQLQTALDSRVSIEQAKGMLAEHAGVDVETAFESIRAHARSNNLKLKEVATRIVSGDIGLDDLISKDR